MGSYEEIVVDREVEAAWLTFRVRLADHVVSMREGDLFRLVVLDADGDDAVRISGRAVEDGVVRGRFVARRARTRAAIKQVTDGLTHFLLRPETADERVGMIHDVLRFAMSVAHPAFVHVELGDLVLVDPVADEQQASTVELPDAVTPTSHADLAEWVRLTVAERIGRKPRVRDDGSIGLSRDDDVVHVRLSSTRPIIEVWATVARDVDVRRARKMVARMNADFHFFAFALQGDRVVVSTTVFGRPFCPAHLDRAIETTFTYLQKDAPQFRARLQRREQRHENRVDDDLLLIFGAADDRRAMVGLARGLSADSDTTLARWRTAAQDSARAARARARDASGVTQDALIEQSIAWRRVADALHDATTEIADERAAR